MKGEEEDDQPTYVVEDGIENVSKAELDVLREQNQGEKELDTEVPLSAKEDDVADSTTNADKGKDTSTDETPFVKQHVAGIGASNKRKIAKAIGDGIDQTHGSENAAPRQQVKSSKIRKGKKVKLSFDESALES